MHDTHFGVKNVARQYTIDCAVEAAFVGLAILVRSEKQLQLGSRNNYKMCAAACGENSQWLADHMTETLYRIHKIIFRNSADCMTTSISCIC